MPKVTTCRARFALVALAALTAESALAIDIAYDLASLGGSAYRYDYVLNNDGSLGLGVPVESFDIGFPDSLITSWSEIGADPGDWDEFSLPVLGDDLFGADALSGGLAVGDSLEFSVWFDWSGTGTPGDQEFTIYDPVNFDILETGMTRAAAAPLPGVSLLMGIGAIGMVLARRRRASQTFAD